MEVILSYLLGLGPYVLAAILAAIAIVGFAPWVWKHPERWLFWVILILSFGPATGDPSGDGSLVRQISWGVFFAISAALLVFGQKEGDLPLLKLAPTGLILLVGLLTLSVAWSPAPFISFKRAIQAAGVLLIGLLVARNTLRGHTLQSQLQPSVFFMVAVGLCAAVLVPSMSFDADHAFRGISPHKNGWGQLSLLASLIFLCAWLANRRNTLILVLGLLPAIISLFLTRSTTSLLSFIFIAGGIAVWMLASGKGGLGKLLLIGVVITVALSFHGYLVFTGEWPLDAVSDYIFRATGKDQSLTGRKYLWQLMYAEIAKHPFLGTGYGGFWTNNPGPSAILVSKLNWGPPVQAHSGYIDIVNEIGILGALLLTGVLIQHSLNIFKLARINNSYVAVFHGALLFSVLIINYAESSLLRTTHIWWIMICVSIFEVHVLTRFPNAKPAPINDKVAPAASNIKAHALY